ncbi:MAG: hypothetical protein R3D58_00365 [Saprospiraceae bacterium]|nr:hypothetical protein [Lewinellaceae bacterium]
MHWRFDPLFSIAVCHSKYKDPDQETGVPPNAPDFVLEPTPGTAENMHRLGWVFKPEPGGCRIFGEKRFDADGSSSLRAQPADGEGLTFALRLTNPALLNETKPYATEPEADSGPDPVPADDLPHYSGNARILYLDNRTPTAELGGILRIAVGRGQLGSRAGVPFLFRPTNSAAQNLELVPLAPGGVSQTVPIPPQTRALELNLSENGYRLTLLTGNDGPSEIIYFTNDLLRADTLGIVRIFKPAGGSGWESGHRYQVFFEQA